MLLAMADQQYNTQLEQVLKEREIFPSQKTTICLTGSFNLNATASPSKLDPDILATANRKPIEFI